jgi:UDP-3-O-[3-hydroxymyristoyl] glucosamine N-acyltransferase
MKLPSKKRSLQEVADFVQGRVVGDGRAELVRVSSIPPASMGDLVFVEDEKGLSRALESGASAVIAGEFAGAKSVSKPLLISSNPRLAFARAQQLLGPMPLPEPGVHPSAVVHSSARIAETASIGARAVIGKEVEIGAGTQIGAGSVIEANVRLGRGCTLYPNVTIYAGARIGDRVVVHAGAVLGSDGFGYVRDPKTGHYEKFPQVGRLEIEDDVEIGANSTVDRGALEVTRIGRGSKIDNLVHIGHNCRIGEDVIIAAQTGLSGSIVVENNVVMGGQVGIGEHAHIEEGVMLGGQSGVLPNKIFRGKGIAFWGTPARPVREYLKQIAALARLAKKE